MNCFLMHVGEPGNVDILETVTRRRSITEILDELHPDAPERSFFQRDKNMKRAFPDGMFNCWGIPLNDITQNQFDKTNVGDAVLFAPKSGPAGGIKQIGEVKAKCPVRAEHASKILWSNTPFQKVYPLLFFFDTEVGFRSWDQFLTDIDYNHEFKPTGRYRLIKPQAFGRWTNGAQGYLKFLREEVGFKKLVNN